MSRPSVLLGDPDVLARDVVRGACTAADIDVIGEVGTFEIMRRLAVVLRPTVVIAADRFGDVALEDVLADLLPIVPKVIVLSADPSPRRLCALLAAGASGYLLHDAAPAEVAAGVFAVARGAAVLNPTATAILVNQWRRLHAESAGSGRPPSLTKRELEVLLALVRGLPTKGIAQELSMATKTVENHKIRIFDKLGVRTQAQAVSVAIGLGLVPAAVG
jgi:DNA-binding NarL/FixJ family response regulator